MRSPGPHPSLSSDPLGSALSRHNWKPKERETLCGIHTGQLSEQSQLEKKTVENEGGGNDQETKAGYLAQHLNYLENKISTSIVSPSISDSDSYLYVHGPLTDL